MQTEREADLARCRPGQELAEGDEVRITLFAEPAAPGDELLPEIA
jgi:hypothetical protein